REVARRKRRASAQAVPIQSASNAPRQIDETGSETSSAAPAAAATASSAATTLRERASGKISLSYPAHDIRERLVLHRLPVQKVGHQRGIRERQKRAKRRFFPLAGSGVAPVEVALQQHVQLPHAAPALPADARVAHRCDLQLPLDQHLL